MSDCIPVIGLEIHVELGTKSKMFCQCSADWFGREPNTYTCPVCLGLPGALPVPNKLAVEQTVLIGKTLNCRINETAKFDRKHYFYPDLPKGYQISQYDEPIAERGKFEIRNSKSEIKKIIRITRVHLEEDTGKLIHPENETLVDFNRSGVPLVEIVTEPDFDNSDDVKRFLEELQIIIRYLGVSDADMEEGSMRIEPNISLKSKEQTCLPTRQGAKSKGALPNYKVEIKNINSFNFVKRAIEYEIKRQTELIDKGETPIQETRGFDESKMKTFSQRTKEEANDYRYFPEPDIPPMKFTHKFIDDIKVPELPADKIKKYIEEFGIKETDAYILTRNKNMVEYFEAIISKVKNQKLEQEIANAIVNKKVSAKITVDEFVEQLTLQLQPKKVDEPVLATAISSILQQNQAAVNSFKAGKKSVIMFLVGQVMKELKGQADAVVIKDALIKKLSKI